MPPRDHTKYHTEGQQNFLHTCASMDGVRMARTFFDIAATFGRGAVIDPASWCGSYEPRALMVVR